ncbi:MAG TPA: hypothetical protein VFV05_12445 [Methylomirabilota bacterium]|nr:hypothetical protein [Methylomirabilota bacterium]
MRRVPIQTILVLAVLAVVSLGAYAPAVAQDGWSWIVTPQLWLTHIEKNGFHSPAGLGNFPIFDPSGTALFDQFPSENSKPVEDLYPQWGLQVAAQKNRWTVAGSFQYVSFETRSDVIYRPDNGLPLIGFSGEQYFPGDRVAQEFLDTTRIDMDFGASYLFPDVIPGRLDFSVGAGVKLIYAETSRQYANLSLLAATLNSFNPPGLYLVCRNDDCSDAGFRDRVKTTDFIYGATIPMNATVHLTEDAKWLLPVSITPFLGAETRDDRDVVYSLEADASSPTGVRANRIDGTTFAYGVTADVTVRYLLSDTVSVYGGGRVQYINGHEEYLAYGPIVGMSVRFGGK